MLKSFLLLAVLGACAFIYLSPAKSQTNQAPQDRPPITNLDAKR